MSRQKPPDHPLSRADMDRIIKRQYAELARLRQELERLRAQLSALEDTNKNLQEMVAELNLQLEEMALAENERLRGAIKPAFDRLASWIDLWNKKGDHPGDDHWVYQAFKLLAGALAGEETGIDKTALPR